jgi:hypothetical protein
MTEQRELELLRDIQDLVLERHWLREALSDLLWLAENQQETDSDPFDAAKKKAHLALNGQLARDSEK